MVRHGGAFGRIQLGDVGGLDLLDGDRRLGPGLVLGVMQRLLLAPLGGATHRLGELHRDGAAGEDGAGRISFNDFQLTYLVGSIALAVILFDGGLRTPRSVVRIALWPALSLSMTKAFVTLWVMPGP